MPGIDLLISKYLSLEFKKNLDQNILKKIEKELFFEHGMSIKLSIEHYEKFHNVLKKNLEDDCKNFEKDCLDKIIQVNQNKNNYVVKIVDQKLSDKIFDFYGDFETRKILMSLMGSELTISEILKISRVLKSPAYRKIENLLLEGLILESGKILKNNKRVSRFSCIFDKVYAVINNDTIALEGILNSIKFKHSSISKVGLFEN
ncbi:MAG: transcriptional regulator [Nitrosopumilus sp.]|nr:transcriptional regulator [Nitrosopumilus sp.]MDH3824225.1 transcriptional regulator [Nitrosopumilus sp.]